MWQINLSNSLCSLLLATVAMAQQVHGHVTDPAGSPIADATVTLDGTIAAHTDAVGSFSFSPTGTPKTLTASFHGLEATVQLLARPNTGADIELVLRPVTLQQDTTVTTTRSSVDLSGFTNSVETIDQTKLTQYPALTLDERLRQHAGFELFRRSSSWVANPTSEGISLRGLGSTAASRTLVLSELVPLNDGFGGWIHWNEMPPETIAAVTLASGGGSDLYGSSALGGVIDIVPSRPGPLLAEADLSAAAEDTSKFSGRADAQQSKWSELIAAQSFRTAGYTIVAPDVRGTVDVPSNVHYQSGRFEVDRALRRDNRASLTGNLLNEAHGNGTPIQTNGTRLWRYTAGDDWTAGSRLGGRVRAFGSDEAYRQTFSAINAARSSESLTRLQAVRTQEYGASADASLHFERLAFVTGGDLRDLRATDLETPYASGSHAGGQDTTARQRYFGGFVEALAARAGWSAAASLRVDEAQNLSTRTLTKTAMGAATEAPSPDRNELVLSPRIGLSKQLPHQIEVHTSAFRAFRTPTMNELYRTGQVGSLITLPNANLRSERATGVEAGTGWSSPGRLAAIQATYFWTEINRPVSAVLLSGNRYMRENLGQIQSQGVALAGQLHPAQGLSLDFGYQYAHAIVTAFQSQPQLSGLWIPEVPRHTATAQLRYTKGNGSYTLAARESGRAFDDSSNVYELHGFFVLDAYSDYRLRSHISLYLSLQNLLGRSIETARTPNLTLGTPFLAQGGIRLTWKRN